MAKRREKRSRASSLVARREVRKRQSPGRFHDLKLMLEIVIETFFPDELEELAGTTIGWMRRPPRSKKERNSIKFGGCWVEKKVITIHPALDQYWVPAWFVEYTIFHEVLHLVERPRIVNGVHEFHHPGFVRREESFPTYAKGREWERRNLDRLLK